MGRKSKPRFAGKFFKFEGKYPATDVRRYIHYRPYLQKPEEIWPDSWQEHGPLKRGIPPDILDKYNLHLDEYPIKIKIINRDIATKNTEEQVRDLDFRFKYVTDEKELRKRAFRIYIGRFWEFVTNGVFGGKFTADGRDNYVLTNGGLIVPDVYSRNLKTLIESKATKESLKVSDFQLERYGRYISEDLERTLELAERGEKEKLLQVQYAVWLYNIRRPMHFTDLSSRLLCEGSLIGMMRNSGIFGIILPYPAMLALQYTGSYYQWPRTERLSNGKKKIIMSTGRAVPKTVLYDLFLDPERTLESLRSNSRIPGIKETSPLERAGLAIETINWKRFKSNKIKINSVNIKVPLILVGEIADREYYSAWASAFTREIDRLEKQRTEEQAELLWKKGLGRLSENLQDEGEKIPDKDISILDDLDLSNWLKSWRNPEEVPF